MNPYRFGGSLYLDLDGVDEYLTAGTDGDLDSASAATFTYLIRSADVTQSERHFGKYHNTSTWIDNTQVGQDLYFVPKALAAYGYTTSNPLATNDTWYYITIVFDGGGATNADRLKVYVNASEETLTFVGTIPATLPNFSTPRNFLVGGNAYDLSRTVTGGMKDFGVFTSALDASEVSEAYNSGCPIDLNSHSDSANLLWFWRMGDGSGDNETTIYDQAGSNDATCNNIESGDFLDFTCP